MKYTRSKTLSFVNNKGGVGKSTLAYNTAVQFANKGYKTVLIDLDSQCNLTRLALGEEYFENTIFSAASKTIYDVLKGVIEGGADIDTAAQFEAAKGASNLYVLRGDMRLREYENVLSTAYNAAAAGQRIGYFTTSAVDRFLREKGMSEQVDIFIIDTSPTLGLLNRVIFLGTDYFVVPLMPDALSLQGIENLGNIYEQWKINWRDTGKALARDIENQFVLSGEGLFIGYILNSYNVYGQQPIRDHQKWIDQVPGKVKTFLSEKHCRNGLVASSSASSLHDIQDYGRLPAITHENGVAIFNIDPAKAEATQPGSRENIEKAKKEFDELSDNILAVLEKY
ncbi:MAG: AAA family ATPase [Candidatus Saccharimonadales bacterium]